MSPKRSGILAALILLLIFSCTAIAQQRGGLSELLIGKNWQAQSATLAGSNLTITFTADGRFAGFLTADDLGTIPAQRISGTWRAIGPNLFLNYTYNTHADTGYTLQVIPTPAEMVIEINSASESELLGVDGWKRVWVWQRVR